MSIRGYKIRNEDGFSLVELLVVLSLIGLLAGIVTTAYLYAEQSVIRWQKKLKMQNELHVLLQGLSEDMYAAKIIREIGENKLSLNNRNDSLRTYEWTGAQLLLNGKRLNSKKLEIIDFELIGQQFGQPLDRFISNKEQLSDITSIHLLLVVTNGADTMQSKRLVTMRKVPTWKSLHNLEFQQAH